MDQVCRKKLLEQYGNSTSGSDERGAGDLSCSGIVHEGVLAGKYEFVPNAAFLQKMSSDGL